MSLYVCSLVTKGHISLILRHVDVFDIVAVDVWCDNIKKALCPSISKVVFVDFSSQTRSQHSCQCLSIETKTIKRHSRDIIYHVDDTSNDSSSISNRVRSHSCDKFTQKEIVESHDDMIISSQDMSNSVGHVSSCHTLIWLWKEWLEDERICLHQTVEFFEDCFCFSLESIFVWMELCIVVIEIFVKRLCDTVLVCSVDILSKREVVGDICIWCITKVTSINVTLS